VRLVVALSASLVGLGVAATAFAQAPSADAIIDALRPHRADMMPGQTRGIRPAQSPTSVPSAEPHVAGVDIGVARPTRRATAGTHPTAAAAQPAPAPVVDQTPPPPQADSPSIALTIQFRNGSAELLPSAREALDNLGTALNSPALASSRFRIEGHTDTVGRPELNRSLSAERAMTVAAYLQTRYGIAASRLEPVGMGSDKLAVPTGPQVPEARNRRVLVVNIGS